MSTCYYERVKEVMESLTAQRRRFVLAHLPNVEIGQAALDKLVDCAIEEATHSPTPDREAVAAPPYHRHLPKLAEKGLIDYDSEHGSITTTAETVLASPIWNSPVAVRASLKR